MAAPLKLLFVASTPIGFLGGQTAHIMDLTRGLRAAGHEVEHASQADVSPANALWLIHRPSYALDMMSPGWGRRWSYPMLERAVARHVKRKAETFQPDVVLAQDPIALHAVKLALGDKVPIVLTVHGYLVMEHLADGNLQPGRTQDWLQKREDDAYKGADQLVAVDTRIKDHIVARGGDGARTHVMLNFVDTERFSPGPKDERWPGKTVAVVPRRLVAKNGVRYAAEAAGKMGDGFVVAVAGDGPERPLIESMKPANCEMLGVVGHDKLPALLRRADAVLVPSVHEKGVEEATSIAALEGMACGRPTVASAIGGLREIIKDGDTGLLVPERDAEAIARAVRRLRDDPALAERLGRRAREDIVARFSLDARVKDYLAIIEKARKA